MQPLPFEQLLDTRTHFARRLICKGHGQNIVRCNPLFPNKMSDANRDHTGLARTGTRENKQRPVGRQYGLFLLRIE